MKRNILLPVAALALAAVLAISLCSCGAGKGVTVRSSRFYGTVTETDGDRITVSVRLGGLDIPPEHGMPEQGDTAPSGPVEKEPDGWGDPRDFGNGGESEPGLSIAGPGEKEPDGSGAPVPPDSETQQLFITFNAGKGVSLSGVPEVGCTVAVEFDENGNVSSVEVLTANDRG